MTLPATVQDAINVARQKALEKPELALNNALELDGQLEGLGWHTPLTFSAMGEAIPGWHSDPNAADWHSAPPKQFRALYEADQIASQQAGQQGLAHGFLHARGHEIPALNLLYANHALGVETYWLRLLNKYLAYFAHAEADPDQSAFQLDLLPGANARFQRLQAANSSRLPEQADGPLVSVLMPVYNAADTLQFAAQSILDQTWRRLELLLIDDASDDSSLAVAEALRQRDSRVQVIRLRTNGGPYVAKNVGLGLARGDYLTVHDADDWAFPTRLADQLQPLLVDPAGALRVTIGRTLRMQASGRITRFAPLDWITNDGALRLCFPSPLFERGFFQQQLGAWDSVRVAADSELLERLQRFAPKQLMTIERPLMLQLDAENSLTRAEATYIDERGLSPVRRDYMRAVLAWHASQLKLPRLAFPQQPRPFAVPESICSHQLGPEALIERTWKPNTTS